MNKFIVTIVAALAMSFASPAFAADGECHPTTTDPTATLDKHYVDVDSKGVWVYEESNGVPGLQRGGAGDPVDDTCGIFAPDTLII